jgi:ketosteroid isomerase-like protein
MRGVMRGAVVLVALVTMAPAFVQGAGTEDRDAILKAREAVWRAWFAGDIPTLQRLVPAETIVISGGEEAWKHQAEVLQSSKAFHASGGKLVKLEFPHTEVQRFGDVAVTWSTYRLEMEMKGKRSVDAERATEIFVLRDGQWVNPGWHTDLAK